MLPGPMKASCACGCGLFGRPRTGKLEGHVRLCPCKRCQGGRNRTKGLNHQRKAAKALSIPKGASMRSGQEEHWGGAVRVNQAAEVAAALADNLGLLVGEEAEAPADHGRDVRRPGQVEPRLAEPG